MEEQAEDPTGPLSEFEIGGRQIKLQRPASLAVQYEISYAARDNEHRAYAGALAACWPRLGKRVPYRYDPLPYGGRVIEYLLEKGWSFNEITQAGELAFVFLATGVISKREVDEAAEGFPATAEAST